MEWRGWEISHYTRLPSGLLPHSSQGLLPLAVIGLLIAHTNTHTYIFRPLIQKQAQCMAVGTYYGYTIEGER